MSCVCCRADALKLREGRGEDSSGQMELCFEAAESCAQFIRLGQGNNGSTTLCVLPVRTGPQRKGFLCS